MLDIVRRIGARLSREQTAQGMAEYALLAGLIAMVVVATITMLGGNISGVINSIGGGVAAAS
jgi:Flp pilus assembly pilin Flp